ncbi:Ribonuclease HI [Elusimicrobium minutum Pei191]|uniref:Ribonuclease HI n=1 Tax=Elusimicrobium minutum (strain Pei191) TaxID=445932 RepID=B2KDX8_ELUMP|nr:ribonuclease HI family protein [Elusimicrobium minutum]ACC98724.1 Ribonuclease HI [Elusimicrobium minutum Pei191]
MKVIINVDGGSRGNPGPGASAYVIKDAKGKIIAQEGVFLGICTNNEAEFKALLFAFGAAAKLKATHIQIYADSQLLVKQFLGEYKIKSPNLVPIMEEIRKKAKPFSSVQIAHVPREKNKEADKLANIAMDKATKPVIQKMKADAENFYKTQNKEKIINHLSAKTEEEEKPLSPASAKNKTSKTKKAEPEQLELF